MFHHEIKGKNSTKNAVTCCDSAPLISVFIALIFTLISAIANATPSVSTIVIWKQIKNVTFDEEINCLFDNCTLVKKEVDCDDEREINKFQEVRNNRRCFTYTHELPRKKF